MTAACGLANGFLMLFVARIGVAIGEAVLQPSALSLISDFFPRDRKAVPISTYLTASFAGIAVAYIAGGGLLSIAERWDRSGIPLLQTMQPWQVVFLMVSIPSFLAAVLVSLIREPRRQERLRTDQNADQSIPLRELITIARQNLGTYATIIGGPLLVCMYVFALTVWLPSVLTRVHGMSSTEAGAMIGTCFFIGGPIGALGASFLAKMLAKRGHRDAVVRAALYCNLLALLPGIGVAFAPSGTLTVVCFFIFAIVGAGMTTLPQAALQMVAPNEVRSQFAAVWGLFVNVFGLGFGPTIAALISDTLSPDGSQIQTALAIMAVPLLLLSALSIYAGLPSVRRCFEKLNSNA
jgi:MFS family permease